MKNIHILPTEKPSRLFKFANQLHLDTIPKDYYKKYNIYITSDEEINEGDVVIHNFGMGYELENPCDSDNLKSNTRSKIILTTDQDLIADGVQGIDDEFLEWFVKNPSCESIEIGKFHGINTSIAEINYISGDGSLNWKGRNDLRDYKIIIPEEQHPKQETLETAAANLADPALCKTDNWIAGAKWQAERMYSEEEVVELLTEREQYTSKAPSTDWFSIPHWFKQFKKK